MRMTSVLAAAMLLATAAGPTAAQQSGANGGQAISDAERYADCLQRARNEPEAAVERARTWADTGGGDPARHCEAVALMTLGKYAQAGRMLEELAKTMSAERGADVRVHALAQAARAWMLADQPERGEAALTEAIDLRAEDVELWIDRAHARFQMGRYWEAIDDLNRAQELAPQRADVYTYRGSAYRFVDAPQMARENIDRALKIDPDNPGALFESGVLHRLQGDEEAARQAWMKIIRTTPDSPMADAARENLEKMDVQVEKDSG